MAWLSPIYLLTLFISLCMAQTKQPNILFIMADDVGHADVGYHGGAGQIKTPVIDQLAHDGVRLENYYVQPLCTPSRSALMTGRLPIYTGLQHLVILPAAPYGLPLKYKTLPEQLKALGYSTHMVGKWHLGMYKEDYLPHNRGFDSFYGYYQGAEDYFTHSVCASLNQKSYCGLDLHNGTTPDFNKTNKYSTHIFTREAIRMIEQQAKKSSPMFMYMAFQNVHQPQQVPPEYEKPYEFIKNEQRRILAAQMSVMDEGIGNITNALKANGMWNNTIVIFSSDNGGMVQAGTGVGCNYPLRGSKATVWEGGVKVAGFVSGPQLNNPKTISTEWMHVSDWYPTIIKMAGGTVSNNITIDGFDQWETINGAGRSPRKELLHNIDPLMIKYGFKKQGSPFDNRLQAALRVGDYKIVTGTTLLSGWYKPVSVEGEVEEAVKYENSVQQEMKLSKDSSFLQNIFLFNITADPYERNDLSQEKPEVVDQLLARLAEYAESAVPPLNPQAQTKDADPSKHGGSWEPWQ